jgi:hypothetical protein
VPNKLRWPKVVHELALKPKLVPLTIATMSDPIHANELPAWARTPALVKSAENMASLAIHPRESAAV